MGLQRKRDISEGKEHVFRSRTAACADIGCGFAGRQVCTLASLISRIAE